MISGIIITGVMVLQFYSPETALINIGLGGEGTSGFSGALGYLRPSGTFSFISGPMTFFPFVASFVFFGLYDGFQHYGKLLLMLVSAALVVVLPISISRSLLLGVLIVVFGGSTLSVLLRRGLFKFGIAVMIIALVICCSFYFETLDAPREAFAARWTASTTEQGGVKVALWDRFVEDLGGGFSVEQSKPLTGLGIGLGTNAGARLYGYSGEFLISEAEWGRVTGEMGMPLGLSFIIARLVIATYLIVLSIRRLRCGDSLPLLLCLSAVLPLVIGQWGPPVIQGFATLGGGLVLASRRLEPTYSEMQIRYRLDS